MGSKQWVAVSGMGAICSFLVMDQDEGWAGSKGGKLRLKLLGAVRGKPTNGMRKSALTCQDKGGRV